MTGVMKAMLGVAFVLVVVLIIMAVVVSPRPDDFENRKLISPSSLPSANVDKLLTDCFRETINGKHAFEMPSPLHPEIIYFRQLSSENDEEKAAHLVVEACTNETSAWSEKCQDSGTDAITCMINAQNLAQETIKEFTK